MDMVEEVQEMRGKLKKAAMKMLLRQVSMAFAMWYENWFDNKTLRTKLQKMIKRAKNSQLAGAFDRWCEAVDEILELRRKMKKIINRWGCKSWIQLESAWFQPFILKSENPVSKFAFKWVSLYRYEPDAQPRRLPSVLRVVRVRREGDICARKSRPGRRRRHASRRRGGGGCTS
jgi:hypothetical protein